MHPRVQVPPNYHRAVLPSVACRRTYGQPPPSNARLQPPTILLTRHTDDPGARPMGFPPENRPTSSTIRPARPKRYPPSPHQTFCRLRPRRRLLPRSPHPHSPSTRQTCPLLRVLLRLSANHQTQRPRRFPHPPPVHLLISPVRLHPWSARHLHVRSRDGQARG